MSTKRVSIITLVNSAREVEQWQYLTIYAHIDGIGVCIVDTVLTLTEVTMPTMIQMLHFLLYDVLDEWKVGRESVTQTIIYTDSQLACNSFITVCTCDVSKCCIGQITFK